MSSAATSNVVAVPMDSNPSEKNRRLLKERNKFLKKEKLYETHDDDVDDEELAVRRAQNT